MWIILSQSGLWLHWLSKPDLSSSGKKTSWDFPVVKPYETFNRSMIYGHEEQIIKKHIKVTFEVTKVQNSVITLVITPKLVQSPDWSPVSKLVLDLVSKFALKFEIIFGKIIFAHSRSISAWRPFVVKFYQKFYGT